MITRGSFEKWNEEMVERYDIETYYSRSNPIVRYIESRRIYWVLRMLSPQDDENILEVGCGAGHILQKIHRGLLYGIDISPKMLLLANRRLEGRVELKKCDAEAIEYPDNFFDKIICSEVLEHAIDPQKIIKEIRRVSKAGGTVIISIPNENIINKIKDLLIRLKIFEALFKNIPKRMEWHLHDFSLPMLRSIVQCGMIETEIKAILNKILPLRYVIRYKVLK